MEFISVLAAAFGLLCSLIFMVLVAMRLCQPEYLGLMMLGAFVSARLLWREWDS